MYLIFAVTASMLLPHHLYRIAPYTGQFQTYSQCSCDRIFYLVMLQCAPPFQIPDSLESCLLMVVYHHFNKRVKSGVTNLNPNPFSPANSSKGRCTLQNYVLFFVGFFFT